MAKTKFYCADCPRVFAGEEALLRHMRIDHDPAGQAIPEVEEAAE